MAGGAAPATAGQQHNSSRAGANNRAAGAGDSETLSRVGAGGSLGCRGTQVIVIDPAAFIEDVKSQLAFKQGIPEDQQRLVFNAGLSGTCELPESLTGVTADCGSLDLATECQSWRAILFEDGKAIGQLCSPSLKTDIPSPVSSIADNKQFLSLLGIDITIHHLVYERWLPSWVTVKGATKPLYIPLGAKFLASSYRIQVIGRLGGQTFALPSVFEATGKQLASGLSLHQQRAEYVRKHQISRSSTGASSPVPDFPATHPSDAAVLCGLGFERFAAVFDIEDRPVWLKRLVLPVVVAALKPTQQATAEVQWPLATETPTTGPVGVDNASGATKGPKQQPHPTQEPPSKKKPNRKRSKGATSKAKSGGSGGGNVASALQNTLRPQGGKHVPGDSHPQAAGREHKQRKGQGDSASAIMSVESVKEMSQDQQSGASGQESGAGQQAREEDLPPGEPLQSEEKMAGRLHSPQAHSHTAAGHPDSTGSASNGSKDRQKHSSSHSARRLHGGQRNGDHQKRHAVLQGDIRSRILPLLQKPFYASTGDVVRPGSTDMASLALGDGWECPVALPRAGAISACSTPTSGVVNVAGGAGSQASMNGIRNAPSREPSAEQVVQAAAEALTRSAQGRGKNRPRRRWSADLDRSDEADSGDGRRRTEDEARDSSGEEAGHQSADQAAAIRVQAEPEEETQLQAQVREQVQEQVGSTDYLGVGLPVADFVSTEAVPRAPSPTPAPLDQPYLSGAGFFGGAVPSIAQAPALLIPSADTAGSSPDNTSTGSSDDSYESSYPVSKNLQTDLERLIVQVIPMIHLPGQGYTTERKTLANMKLKTIWDWYEEPSMYGREVYTLGGARGASMSYYIPYISAIRLFSPVSSKDKDSADHAGPVFTCDLDGMWSKMKLVYEFIETSPPKDRIPLFEKIEALHALKGQAAGPSASGQWNNELVLDLKFQDVHPHSWYAVSWYPIYRIPDAPLRAAFLTYHTLAPIAAALAPQKMHRRAEAAVAEPPAAPAAAAASQGPASPDMVNSLLDLPVVGLEWYAMGEEVWCETQNSATVDNPEAKQADSAWKAHISELRGTAGRLARSLGAKGGRTLHHDYNFFNLRS